jgi:hypothetical protein
MEGSPQLWLTRDIETVLGENTAYIGAILIELNRGWNTLSTPAALDAACDTWGEFKALGNGLAVDTTVPAYAWNGETQLWVEITDSYVLQPCDAIYVKMLEPDVAPLLLSGDVSVPSKDVYTGWNLVSLSYMPMGGEWPPFGLPNLPAEIALRSIGIVPSDLTGCVQVVSPSLNQESWVGVCGYSQEYGGFWCDYSGSGKMYITEGYWVFMENPGTLAGYAFTPISLSMMMM